MLAALSAEIWRIFVPGGVNVFTVQTKQDAHYGSGIHRGENSADLGRDQDRELQQRDILGR